jgi:hypothetical protein
MHQTTVRFGADLWADLEREAAATGVSAAQYIREAALSRLAYSAGRRGEPGFGAAIEEISGASLPPAAVGQRSHRMAVVEGAEGQVESSTALWAQGRLARARARELRERAGGWRRS